MNISKQKTLNRSQKKCRECGEWTHYSMQPEDVCEHCGTLLSTHKQEMEARADKIKNAPKGLFPVNESDSVILKAGKFSINAAHVVFTAIVSFVVWFITFVVT